MSRETREPRAGTMTCAEVEKVLEAFVDGELPGSTMREAARHLASCASCEAMAVRLERVQETVCRAVLEEAGDVDTVASWKAIAPHLTAGPVPLRERLESLGERLRFRGFSIPLWVGSAAAAAIVAAVLWVGSGPPPEKASGGFQAVPRQARIDVLDAPGSVRVWNQPESGALVIWVDEQGIQAKQPRYHVNAESVAQ